MSGLDAAIVCAYAIAVLWIGWRVSRRDASADALALAERRVPVWAALLSMSATELSAATFIGVPQAAYLGDWSFLQLAFGSLLAKVVLAARVITLYHRLEVVTVYGFLELRFGGLARRLCAGAFVLGRLGASGVRLFIAALALSVATGLPIEGAILLAGGVAGLYTLAGGLRAVIWTDTLQAGLLIVGALALIVTLGAALDGGWPGILEWARAGDRTRVFHLTPLFSLASGTPFGVALIGAFFLTLATHATDHDMVQRLLATRDGRGGGRALLGSALLNFPLTALFLLIGTGLAWFYATAASSTGPAVDASTRVLPIFALNEVPAGLRGLLFAGLFAAAMSSLDSAICALSTTWVYDVRPGPPAAPASAARIRVGSLCFAALLVSAAIAMAHYHAWLEARPAAEGGPSLIDFALSSMTILYGALLGVFGLGILTRERGSPRSVAIALVVGACVGLALFLQPVFGGETRLAWPWWVPVTAALSFGIGCLGRRERA